MMNLVDREKFVQTLGYYGADYAGYSLSESVVDSMLTRFSNQKQHIYKMFGEKLKIEKEIETVVGVEEAKAVRLQLVAQLSGPHLVFVRSLLMGIGLSEFTTNVLERDINIFGVKLPKGLKLSKAIIKMCLPKYAHEVSVAHSMANQKLFTKGKAVLSIDPVDFITMSSNASGWRSCHRLDGGEYRTGPLAYLMDSSSVICYIESKTPCKFERRGTEYEHSNKSWRQIALVNPDCGYVIQERQYPARNSLNQNAISQLFVEALNQYHGTNGYTYKNTYNDTLNNLHIDFANYTDSNNMYYNDINNEMFDSANVVFNGEVFSDADDINLDKPTKGEDVMCLCCGDYLDDSESLYCYDCCD